MIYVVLHKETFIPKKKFYIPILVGDVDFRMENMITDSSGISIHFKNKYYAELTALFWIHKNVNDEIKGLVHYRRYFIQYPYSSKKLLRCSMLSENKIRDHLSRYDIIVPMASTNTNVSLFNEYSTAHFERDMIAAKEVVLELYPEYRESFEYVIESNQKKLRFYHNMFIASSVVFDNYCEWLFNILFELEKRIDISEYDDYQKRIFGFISERLFNVYVHRNKLKYKEINIVNIEEKRLNRLFSLLVHVLLKLRLYSIARRIYRKVLKKR